MLCTANVCRSPMAEGFLRRKLAVAGVDARVGSAGLLDDDLPAADDGIAVMAGRGIDTSQHRSRVLMSGMIDSADLVIGMARDHVREAVLMVPDAWSRTFTLKEIVRRGADVGRRAPDQPLDEWLNKLHAGRTRGDLLGASPDDDVADPIGQSRAVYERTADELDELTDRLVLLLGGS